jgi:CDP-diglyceride synthetase
VIILQIVYLMVPVILAGSGNMVFVKVHWLDALKKPVDGGLVLPDGERLFGENKTWKGFAGMIVLSSLFTGMCYFFYQAFPWARELSLIPFAEFSTGSAFFWGGFWGLGYVLFELPNSFVKRRLKIPPGRNVTGARGVFFYVLDQADSVIGCSLFMLFFYRPPLAVFFGIIGVGIAVHLAVNLLLFALKLKKQAG